VAEGWGEAHTSVVPGGWTIGLIANFYVIFPLLSRLITNLRRAIGFVVFALLLDVVFSPVACAVLTPLYLPEHSYLVRDFLFMWFVNQLPLFGLGIVVYHVMHKLPNRSVLVGLLLAVGAVGWLVMLSVTGGFLLKLVAFGVGFSVLALALQVYPVPILVNPVMSHLGRMSLGLYLSHFAVLKVIPAFLSPEKFPLTGDWGTIVAFLLILLFSVALSQLVYAIIEKPAKRLEKKVITAWC
jgi:peptidoglycan/LPS O-acetylase OafA/YrhL